MFAISKRPDDTIAMVGRFDASQLAAAREVLDAVTSSAMVDFGGLDYISSAGLGLLLGVQKRLSQSGNSLKILNMNDHIRELFRIAGFDRIFEID